MSLRRTTDVFYSFAGLTVEMLLICLGKVCVRKLLYRSGCCFVCRLNVIQLPEHRCYPCDLEPFLCSFIAVSSVDVKE